MAPALSAFPEQGDKITRGGLTPAFLGARKRAEWIGKPCILGGPKKRDNIKSGQPTPVFLRGQKRADSLHNPCILGGPKTPGGSEQWAQR